MHFVIHNTQAFGDMLLGTHVAKFIKKHITNCHITFAINQSATLTTAEKSPDGLFQMAEILLLQEGLDTIGLVNDNKIQYLMGKKSPNDSLMKIIKQYEWYSDLGIVKSMFTDLFQMGFGEHNTETEFWFGRYPDRPTNRLKIVTLGPLDWNKKWGNEEGRKKILSHVSSKNVELIQIGRDIKQQRYLQALQQMQDCHLYLGPAGSVGHAAAGVGMDTIVLCEVFPPQVLSPEFYHSGYHKSIVARAENHCGSYKCITQKKFDIIKSQEGFGNPVVEFNSFWTPTCTYMPDNKSCVAMIQPEQLIDAFDMWYNERKDFHLR